MRRLTLNRLSPDPFPVRPERVPPRLWNRVRASRLSVLIVAGALIRLTWSLPAAEGARAGREGRRGAEGSRPASQDRSSAPGTFAPLPEDHPLASIWNNPDFVRRLVGSYGFLSEAEPRMTPEEQALYRDKIVPILREDAKKAIPDLEAAVKPGASAVFDFTLGTIYFQNENFTNAVRYYEQALAKFPDYRRAQRNLALTLVREGKYEEAVKPLTRAIALGGADGRLLALLGFSHLNAGRWVSAAAAYREAIVYEPENPDLKLGLVKACIGLNDLDAAAAMLEEMLEQHPERDNLWALQANVFIQQEHPEKAIVNLEILRKMDKATANQLSLLGDLYMTQDNRDLALAAYLESLDRDAAKSPVRGLRPAEILLSRGAFAQASPLLARIRAAGDLGPEDTLKLLKLEARLALATGHADKGIETLEEIIRRNPLDGEALLLAGDYHARNGEPEKAAFRYETASKIEGFEADGFLKLAQLRVRQQKYAEAVELLRRAQRLKPRDNVANYLEKVEQAATRSRS